MTTTQIRNSPSGPLETVIAGVASVFGRAGAVVAALGDYAASLVTNDSSVTGATVKDALDNVIPTGTIAGGGQPIYNGTAWVNVGSPSYSVAAADTTVAPGTDSKSTAFLAALAGVSKTLTVSNAALGNTNPTIYRVFSIYIPASSGAGRWVINNFDASLLWTQPTAGAWILDLQWTGATWQVAGNKPGL